MPEIPRTKFNSPWTVAVIEAALNDVSSAKGSSESLTAALNAMRAEINSLSGGVHLKGAVDYYADLPANPSEGDAYTVRYQGASGTEPLGIEYAWATYQGTPQWIPIGVDPSVFARQDEMNVVANAGAKNALKVTAKSGSSYGITREVSDDGTITLTTGQAQNNPTLIGVASEVVIPKGNWILSGCPSGGGDSTYRMDIRISGTATVLAMDTGSGGNLTLSDDTTCSVFIRLAYNYSVSNLVFKPMIRSAAITDSTFQPYAKTNRELTVLTDEDRAALVEIVDGGAKNVADMTKSTFTSNQKDGVTVTLSGDMITSTGTSGSSTNQFHRILYDAGKFLIPAGTWIAALIGTGTDAFRIEVNSSSYSDLVKGTFGNPVQFTIPEGDTESYARITQKPNTNCAGTFRLMICTPASWKISQAYQPYRPSWQEMWDAIQALQSGGTRSLTMQMQPTEITEQEER